MIKKLDAISAIIMFSMYLFVIISVILRVFFNASASWSMELTQFCFIAVTFIGSTACMADETHIQITAFTDRVNKDFQKILRIIGRLLMIPFFVIFILGTYKNILFNWKVGFITVNWLKIGYVYLILFISGIIILFYLFINLYRDFYNKKIDSTKTEGETR
jgi:TRAP-type transport system small permease protein